MSAVLYRTDTAYFGNTFEVGNRPSSSTRVISAYISQLSADYKVVLCWVQGRLKVREGRVPHGLAKIQIIIRELYPRDKLLFKVY